jgi:hypothetical protein
MFLDTSWYNVMKDKAHTPKMSNTERSYQGSLCLYRYHMSLDACMLWCGCTATTWWYCCDGSRLRSLLAIVQLALSAALLHATAATCVSSSSINSTVSQQLL